MVKKVLAVLLSLALLLGAAPQIFAASEDGWLIYFANKTETGFDAVIVAPAKYTRLSDEPQIETVCTTDHAERSVCVPAAEQIRFSFGGKTETRFALTVSCTRVDSSVSDGCFSFAVLPGSVLDNAGTGNARVSFEDEVDYLPAEGYAEIDVASGLLRRDYELDDETVAVGDTLRVEYSGLYPVEIFLNGEQAASFPGGEMQRFTYGIAATGSLCVSVRQGGKEIAPRSLTVISSAEMYRRNLRGGLLAGDYFVTAEDLVGVGVPAGSIFIPLAMVMAFFVGVKDFLQRLFSFVRITR